MTLRTVRRGLEHALAGGQPHVRADLLEVHAAPPRPWGPALRVATWNLQAGYASSIERLADVLRGLDPDIVAVQEADRWVPRSGRVHQVARLGGALGMSWAFCSPLRIQGGHFGIGLLARRPLQGVLRHLVAAPGASEPRAILEATVAVPFGPLRLVTTHADFLPWAAAYHARRVLRLARGPTATVVLGDLNLPPWALPTRALGWRDAIAAHDEGPTYVASPRLRVDHILLNRALAGRLRGAARVLEPGSDHYAAQAVLHAGRLG